MGVFVQILRGGSMLHEASGRSHAKEEERVNTTQHGSRDLFPHTQLVPPFS
jgi:hypothetical protein